MRRGVVLPAVLVGLGTAAAVAGPVDFQIVSQSVLVDRVGKTATFALTFNQKPDFSLVPGDGQANAFQYEVDPNWAGLDAGGGGVGFDDINAIVRGSEIWEGTGLPIRQRDGNGGEPNVSGGWGPVRDIVPFEVKGDAFSFTTSLDDLGDSDGVFRYRVFATDRGRMTSEINGNVIPLPAAVATGLVMLGGVGFARRFARRR